MYVDDTNLFVDVHWQLTYNCVYNCEYCFRKNYHTDKYSSLALCMHTCNTLKNIDKISNLTLIGGEPTLHPQFLNIIDKCKDFKNIENITIYSNGHDKSILLAAKSMLKHCVFMLSYHSKMVNLDKFMKTIIDLLSVNANVHCVIMLELNEYNKVVECINKCKKIHNEHFMFSVVPIMDTQYSEEYLSLIPTSSIDNTNKIYYKFIDGTIEIYNDNEIKILPSKYHSFTLMQCYSNSFITIDPNCKFYSRCDNKKLDIDNIAKEINTSHMCTKQICYHRDDIRFIYKYLKSKPK